MRGGGLPENDDLHFCHVGLVGAVLSRRMYELIVFGKSTPHKIIDLIFESVIVNNQDTI